MHNRKHPNKISSFKGALEEVRRLKKITEEDYTAYKHLKYLGCYYGEQIMKENYEIMKEKLKQKNIPDFILPCSMYKTNTFLSNKRTSPLGGQNSHRREVFIRAFTVFELFF